MVYTLWGICVPAIGWADGSGFFIEKAQQMKAVADLPQRLVNLFKRDMIFGQDLRYVEQLAPPPNFAIGTDMSHGNIAAIFQSRQFDRVGLWRRSIHFAWDVSIQRFV